MRSTLICLTLTLSLLASEPPEDARAWWSHVRAMASDANQGRDTGSAGYRRAEAYVIREFARLGLRPSGERGFAQPVKLYAVELRPADTRIELVRDGKRQALRFLDEISITAAPGLPEAIEAPLVLADDPATEVRGKFAVVHGAGRAAALEKAGAVGVLTIDNPRATEPPRWPVAYAKTVRLTPPAQSSFFQIRLSTEAAAGILRAPGSLRIRTKATSSELLSDNVIAAYPGELDEYVVLSAHLDGYGIGQPVNGDRIYNGAFDDCAYVATLMEFAAHLKASGAKPKRGILFTIFTGEEKGLLGSAYFTAHPTVAKEKLVANLNLDYLRPIFPLRLLTVLALDQSTLGDDARRVARGMGLRVQADQEPERGLYRRSDQFNFLKIGVPALAFIFGYEAGSAEEKIYRQWYMERYHKPADDLHQPVDFAAAIEFNRFFEKLALEVANAPERPRLTKPVGR
ncbi:MAG: M20/M25/M40 family metallo-hydrolase [Bryobacteraceae bacterium]|nr:M20/M25/M40 family metallo-hydrolase [Bryobacteraceae bacterium]